MSTAACSNDVDGDRSLGVAGGDHGENVVWSTGEGVRARDPPEAPSLAVHTGKVGSLDNFAVFVIVVHNEVGSVIVDFSKPFYSPHEVATIAGVHPSTILNYIASGRLYAVKLSERTYRIPVRAVMGLLEPERVSPSTIVVEPDADVEHEIPSEGAEVAGV